MLIAILGINVRRAPSDTGAFAVLAHSDLTGRAITTLLVDAVSPTANLAWATALALFTLSALKIVSLWLLDNIVGVIVGVSIIVNNKVIVSKIRLIAILGSNVRRAPSYTSGAFAVLAPSDATGRAITTSRSVDAASTTANLVSLVTALALFTLVALKVERVNVTGSVRIGLYSTSVRFTCHGADTNIPLFMICIIGSSIPMSLSSGSVQCQ